MNNPITTFKNLSTARKKHYARVAAFALVGLGVIWTCADDAHQKRERRRIAQEEYNMIRQAVLQNRQPAAFPVVSPEDHYSPYVAASHDAQRRASRQRELEMLRRQVEEDEEKLDQRISEGGAGVIYQGRISRAKSRVFDLENGD